MRPVRTYADRAAAELDLALLRANRIDAVLDDDAGGTGGGAPGLRVSVPADQHLPALAILTDEADSHAQVPAVARSAARRTAVVLIRASALFFVVNALLYLAAIGERVWRGGAAQPPTARRLTVACRPTSRTWPSTRSAAACCSATRKPWRSCSSGSARKSPVTMVDAHARQSRHAEEMPPPQPTVAGSAGRRRRRIAVDGWSYSRVSRG